MFALAGKKGFALPYASVEALQQVYQFTNLQSFLDIYYAGAGMLLHEHDFHEMTRAYLQRASEDNVGHTEIFFDPQAHTERAIGFHTVMAGHHQRAETGS